MASLETPPLLEDRPPVAPTALAAPEAKGWKLSAILADIATLGTGTLLAGVFNAALVFVIPRLISVEDYGYWRMFGLYAGYVGFLHFGFADGALLRWAGRPWEDFKHEVGPGLKYLVWQHVLVLLPLGVMVALVLRGPLRFVAIAVAIYAPLYNITATLQFALQGARIFRPVAIAAVAAPGLLLASALVWASRWQSGSREVIVFYLLTWCVPLVFLLAWTKPLPDGSAVRGLAKDCVRSGWPIVLANTGFMLIMYADRLAASWAATIQTFAQYSMAASAMAVPITVIQACSNVFFPHLAGATLGERKRVYGIASRTLLMAWAILLPYYFVLEMFMRNFLSRYVPSLQYARALLLGIPFLAAIQILQMNYAYVNGRQRHFLVRTVAVLAASLGVTSFAAFHFGSLQILAGIQVAIMGAWWLLNEWILRRLTGQSAGDWIKFATVYALAAGGYWFASGSRMGLGAELSLYYPGAAIVLGALCRDELRTWLSLIARHNIRDLVHS